MCVFVLATYTVSNFAFYEQSEDIFVKQKHLTRPHNFKHLFAGKDLVLSSWSG